MGQIAFDGAISGQHGLMHEESFNNALARALRQRRKAWRSNEYAVQCERLRTFIADPRARPDLIVHSPDAYPIAIEVEWGNPAIEDAEKRLGRIFAQTMLPVRSVIAIGVENEVRSMSDEELESRLASPKGIRMRFVWLAASIADEREMEDVLNVYRWPREGSVSGDAFDLADLCDLATAPPRLVEEQTANISQHIRGYASALKECVDEQVAMEMASSLGQGSVDQGLRLACCIWMTSWRMHDHLAELGELRTRGLRTISELRSAGAGLITLSAIRDSWRQILDYNYRSIFHPALVALHDRIPNLNGAEILDGIARLSEQVAAARLGNSVDFAGELFPKLLDDRADTAAFYTLPPSAELLASMAVNRLEFQDWSCAEAVARLKIADLACGTGTLLRATYARIRSKHDSYGGEAEGLHRAMMEKSITGLDINVLATHMTAAGLSGVEISTPHNESNIGSVGIVGGLTGSLELLVSDEVADITGEGVRLSDDTQSRRRFISVPNRSQDLVIQNPPYTRAHGGRGVFAVAGLDAEQRKLSAKRLASQVSKLRRDGSQTPNGQAGLGTHFSALADAKLRHGGVFSTVLPLTASRAESWQGFREDLVKGYRDLTAVTVASDSDFGFSADTDINEMLLVANKRRPDDTPLTEFQVLCVNLRQKPATVAESMYVSRSIAELERTGGEDGLLTMDERVIGSWIRIRLMRPGFPWFALGLRNQDLARVFSKLLRGRLFGFEGVSTRNFALEMTCLEDVADIGPTHHRIGHVRGNEAIGAFTFDAASAGDAALYPALWSADGQNQNKMVVKPTHNGTPYHHSDQSPKASKLAKQNMKEMLANRGSLFVSRNLRLTSQALASALTESPALGGNAWTVLANPNEGVGRALALWFNGTLGLVTRTGYGQSTQRGRSLLKIKALGGLPVPDFAGATTAAERARSIASREFDRLSYQVMEPASYAWRDPVRCKVDEVVLDMLGIDAPETRQVMNQIRRIWCREPAVHGSNRKILKALNVIR